MAVGFEEMGKGCRIFTDSDLAGFLLSKQTSIARFPVGTFAELRNPLSGEIVDEFCWYLQNMPGKAPVDKEAKHLALLELMSLLMYSPRFNWNASSEVGKMQLACSIASISAATREFLPSSDTVFNVEYLMVSLGKRSVARQEKAFKLWGDEAKKAFDHKQRNKPTEIADTL
ncbi:hypothetical protein SAMN04489801_4730 [Pseudomonas mandelii]|uniref:Uncharacterized protein n=2 Tax=Pseudomonas mandelii TaxID=75612 RepID=A0ABY0VVY6_9PSED|nr:hypothetical protein SAMN04489801_4730 [Pseudomonas mandelii]